MDEHEEMQECNTCRWYDPMEGYCIEREIYCRGSDGDDCGEYQAGWKK